MDFPLSADYQKWKPENYTRGLFSNTVCTEYETTEVYNYEGMLGKLRALADGPNDAELVSIAKTPGYGSSDNALDIWSLQIPATVEPKYTLFLVSGHHYEELPGPTTVYEIASRILDADREGNMNVKLLRELVRIVCVPQVDSDAYAHFWDALAMEPKEFYQEAYQRYLDPALGEDILLWNRTMLEYDVRNQYTFVEGDFRDIIRAGMFPVHYEVKKGFDRVIAEHGKPTLSIDFHESPMMPLFSCIQIGPLYEEYSFIHRQVGKYYPTISEASIPFFTCQAEKLESERAFSGYMSHLDAKSYVIESPDALEHESVEMGLIATDCILALHLWGLLDSE